MKELRAQVNHFILKIFKNTLLKKKIRFIKFREPGGSQNSEKIRNFMLNKKSNYKSLTDLFMYMAARNENYHNIIKKYYKKRVILIDRFTDSTLAYQHYGMGIDKKLIINLNKIILKKIKPNFTFVNTVNMKNLKYRINNRRKNRYDKFSIKFYNKVQKGFIKLSKSKKNYMIINSNLSIFENKNKIINKVKSLISK